MLPSRKATVVSRPSEHVGLQMQYNGTPGRLRFQAQGGIMASTDGTDDGSRPEQAQEKEKKKAAVVQVDRGTLSALLTGVLASFVRPWHWMAPGTKSGGGGTLGFHRFSTGNSATFSQPYRDWRQRSVLLNSPPLPLLSDPCRASNPTQGGTSFFARGTMSCVDSFILTGLASVNVSATRKKGVNVKTNRQRWTGAELLSTASG
jgi:hypothetical protein